MVEIEYNVNNCKIIERNEKEPNMVEQRKLINQKATSATKTKEVLLKKKEDFKKL